MRRYIIIILRTFPLAAEARCATNFPTGRVVPLPGPYTQIASSASNVCGLRDDGSVACWGYDWGNGAGDETCRVAEAHVMIDGELHELDAGDLSWGYNAVPQELQTGGAFRYFNAFSKGEGDTFNESPLAMIAGMAALEPGVSPGESARKLFPDGTPVELSASVWALDANASESGEVQCSGPSSGSTVTRNGDELVFDLKLTSLGKCPGEPVDGEISVCIDNCTDANAATATLHGTAWTAHVYSYGIGGNSDIEFSDGSRLQYIQPDNGGEAWGLLFTAPDGPYGGELFCIGTASACSIRTRTRSDRSRRSAPARATARAR